LTNSWKEGEVGGEYILRVLFKGEVKVITIPVGSTVQTILEKIRSQDTDPKDIKFYCASNWEGDLDSSAIFVSTMAKKFTVKCKSEIIVKFTGDVTGEEAYIVEFSTTYGDLKQKIMKEKCACSVTLMLDHERKDDTWYLDFRAGPVTAMVTGSGTIKLRRDNMVYTLKAIPNEPVTFFKDRLRKKYGIIDF